MDHLMKNYYDTHADHAQKINAAADDIVREFWVRYYMPGCSIEKAANVSVLAPREAFRLARSKIIFAIEEEYSRDSADRWESTLRPIWG